MGIKYYYSAPQQIRLFTALTNAIGEPVYVYPGSKLIKNLPRVTVCSVLDDNKLSFGFATCSDKDTYKRKIGQRIAFARAITKPYKTVQLDNFADIHIISDAIVNEIYELESKRIYEK